MKRHRQQMKAAEIEALETRLRQITTTLLADHAEQRMAEKPLRIPVERERGQPAGREGSMTRTDAKRIKGHLHKAWALAHSAKTSCVMACIEEAQSALARLEENPCCPGCKHYIKTWFDHAPTCKES